MKIVVLCPNCSEEMYIKDVVFTPLGELKIHVSECPNDCTCSSCEDLSIKDSKIEQLENTNDELNGQIANCEIELNEKNDKIFELENKLEAIQDRGE